MWVASSNSYDSFLAGFVGRQGDKPMKPIATIARILLGLICVVFFLSVSAILDSMVPNQSGLDTRWLLAQNLVSILRRAGTANPAEHARKVLLRFEPACDGDIKNPHLRLAQHLLCTLYPLALDKLVWCVACRLLKTFAKNEQGSIPSIAPSRQESTRLPSLRAPTL